jgi:hypothetical protein
VKHLDRAARIALVLLAGAVCAIPASGASAQAVARPDSASAKNPHPLRQPERILFSTTAAASSTPSGWLGKTPGRGVFISAIRSTWRLSGSDHASIGYFAELVPLAIVTRNPIQVRPLQECARETPEWHGRPTINAVEYFENCATHSASAYGGGITPLGLSTRISRSSGVALVAELSAGTILFDKTVPYPNTTRLNFNLAAGTSVEIPLRGRAVVSVGYYMHHLSNGGQGEFNPGILAHSFQMGWGRRR